MSLLRRNPVPAISVLELKNRLDAGDEITILDVRQPEEYGFCNIGGTLIPLGELPGRLGELDKNDEIVVVCHSGARSARATQFLRAAGFQNAKNLSGGIDMWAAEVDPTMPRY